MDEHLLGWGLGGRLCAKHLVIDEDTRQAVSGTRKGMIPRLTPSTANIYCHKYAGCCVNTLDARDFSESPQQCYVVGTLLFSNFTDEETAF